MTGRAHALRNGGVGAQRRLTHPLTTDDGVSPDAGLTLAAERAAARAAEDRAEQAAAQLAELGAMAEAAATWAQAQASARIRSQQLLVAELREEAERERLHRAAAWGAGTGGEPAAEAGRKRQLLPSYAAAVGPAACLSAVAVRELVT
eukprot:gene43411-38170_t